MDVEGREERDKWLLRSFEDVMRSPLSNRGMDVDETCRLLAEAAQSPNAPAPYSDLMEDFQCLYLDQFLNTCSVVPNFSELIRKGIARYR